MKLLAPAKLNLYLRVAGKRGDGYHDIETVFQAVSLFDDIELTPAQETKVSFEWASELGGALPQAPDLVESALIQLRDLASVDHVAVGVVKRIPIAAGLGGGSSDAAAALVGVRDLQGDAVDHRAIGMAASRTGADVPFFIRGGTALGLGKGDELTRLESGSRLWWVLGIPEVRISTAEVYAHYDGRGRPLAPLVSELVKAISLGDPSEIARFLYNDLENSAREILPSIGEFRTQMQRAGALGSVLCGSGPSVAGLARDEPHARDVADRVSPLFARVEVVHSIESGAKIIAGS